MKAQGEELGKQPPRKKDDDLPEPHPELDLWCDLLISWINPLIELANKRTLCVDDVWACPPKESVGHQSDCFWKAWTVESENAEAEGRVPSFLWTLFLAYGDRLLVAGVLQFVFMLLQLAQPFLVGELVGFIQTGEGGLNRGLGLALGFGGIAFVSSIILSQVFYTLRRLADAMRAGVMMAVYEQTLHLTTAARLQNSIGQTTNLIAIDAEKLNLAVQFLHFLWHGPLVCVAIMVILITQIGYPAALAGMGFICVLVPLQNSIAATIGTTRRQMVRHTDERVKLINELLQAIRVIKLYAWEEPIEERVRSVRAEETNWLHTYLNRSGQLRELLFATQPVAAIIMFCTASYGSDQPLDVVQIFRMLAFLNITRFPLNLLAQSLKSANDAMVSIQRLQKFFTLPTLHSNGREVVACPEIKMERATFTWEDLQPPQSGRSAAHSSRRHGSRAHSNSISGHDDGDIEGNDAESALARSFCLRSVDFATKKPNELVAVIGTVGSGKSSFISAILNEMILYAGRVDVKGTVSYCAQTPWIQNLSLKQNVLFEVPADSMSEAQQQEYVLAIRAAALAADISILANGDQTEIGERGINLSGGQKARVSLARAFFSRYRSQIYLLDDPFSAVDGNTGNHIFQQGLLTLLKDKLRVVALNSHMHLLKHFDRVIVLESGRAVLDGSVEELFTKHEELMSRITGLSKASVLQATRLGDGEVVAAEVIEVQVQTADKPVTTAMSALAEPHPALLPEEPEPQPQPLQTGVLVAYSAVPTSDQGAAPPALTATTKTAPASTSQASGQLMRAEKMDAGVGLMNAYLKYVSSSLFSLPHIFAAPMYRSSMAQSQEDVAALYTPLVTVFGVVSLVFMFLVFSSTQLFRVGVDLLMAKLGEHWDDSLRSRHLFERWYYICFGCLVAALLLRSVALTVFAVRSSRALHALTLRKVLAAPVPAFFDTHTIGAILNRFAKDMETVDANIPEFMLQLMTNWFQVFAVFGLCIWASPWFAIILLPLGALFYKIYVYFSAASRDLKRLEAVSRSPIYASLSETLAGLETIRAYSDSQRFLDTHMKRMDLNKKLLFHLWVCMSWMTVRLELSTASILCTVALICVCLRDSVSPIALGVALSFGMQLTALFQRCVQLVIEMVTYMTSTERVLEYMELPQEVDTLADYDGPAEVWRPTEGRIVLEDVWMQYRDNPAVLRGISVTIAGGQRVGVCGRTGAGKSSVMMALFRIVNVTSGRILIDGRDTASVPLQQLRSALAIIPQDPVLFTGTIRFQLDPFETYSDEEVWRVLEQVRMADMVRGLPGGLQEGVKENGENLSQGQRQLLCIARALLRRAKILVVDEGTSAVDPHTDELIQQVLRQEVEENGATVLAIAHRLQTIADFDKILVLGAGKVLEFGPPQTLLADPQSVFASMMCEANH